MTIPETIELFTQVMISEIGHITHDETLYDALIQAAKDAAQIVTETYEASEKLAE